MRYPFDGSYIVTSPYGWRIHPVTGEQTFHHGIDFGLPSGTPVVAVDSGTVVAATRESGAGNHLVILLDHPVDGGTKAGYMHLASFTVGVGDRISEGQVVGYSDTTGAVTGPHLHFWLGTTNASTTTDPAPHLGSTALIFGVDISKYQTPSAMEGYNFAILNVEDPYIAAKVERAYDLGIRWDIYKWCYPGQSGQHMFNIAQSRVQMLWRPGTRRPQFWLDYEEAGCEPWQIDQWYAACDAGGEKTGLYCYLAMMNAQGLGFARDGWIAYYPGTNNGEYWPAMSDTARARGAKIHQFTSSAGQLDKNVVLDNAWYGTESPAPPLPDLSFLLEEDEMWLYCQYDGFFAKGGMLYQVDPLGAMPCPDQTAAATLGALLVPTSSLDAIIGERIHRGKVFGLIAEPAPTP